MQTRPNVQTVVHYMYYMYMPLALALGVIVKKIKICAPEIKRLRTFALRCVGIGCVDLEAFDTRTGVFQVASANVTCSRPTPVIQPITPS